MNSKKIEEEDKTLNPKAEVEEKNCRKKIETAKAK
jgi:hypothetical protein